MKTSEAGIEVLHYYEKCSLTAYPDPGSKDGSPWTIGWGHTGPEVKKGLVWTQAQCDDVFVMDLERFGAAVNRGVKVEIQQYEFDAFVCLAYNIGTAAFSGSTALRRFNERNKDGAAEAITWWNKNDGKVMRGLVRRRATEKYLFCGMTAKEAILMGSSI